MSAQTTRRHGRQIGTMKSVASMMVVGLLASCGSGSSGVTVPPQPNGLKRCESARPIAVEDLEKAGRPGCNLVGTIIKFPDGTTGRVGAIGANKSWSYYSSPGESAIPVHFTMVNWGAPGVAVVEHSRQGWIRTIWANSTEASDLLFELLQKSGVPIDEPH